MDILSWTFLPDGRRYQQTDSNTKVKEKAPQCWKTRSQTVGRGLIPNSSLFCNHFSKPISHESIMFTAKKVSKYSRCKTGKCL